MARESSRSNVVPLLASSEESADARTQRLLYEAEADLRAGSSAVQRYLGRAASLEVFLIEVASIARHVLLSGIALTLASALLGFAGMFVAAPTGSAPLFIALMGAACAGLVAAALLGRNGRRFQDAVGTWHEEQRRATHCEELLGEFSVSYRRETLILGEHGDARRISHLRLRSNTQLRQLTWHASLTGTRPARVEAIRGAEFLRALPDDETAPGWTAWMVSLDRELAPGEEAEVTFVQEFKDSDAERGLSVGIAAPTDALTLEVRFPPQRRPQRVDGYSTGLAPSVVLRRPVEVGQRGLVAQMTVARPALGREYWVTWPSNAGDSSSARDKRDLTSVAEPKQS